MDHQTLIQFPESYPSEPLVSARISFIDFDASHNPRVKSLVEAVLPIQAVLNLHSSGGGGRHNAGISWLLCPPWRYRLPVWLIYHQRQESAFFSALDIEKPTHCRVKTYASTVTKNGFKFHIETWDSSKVLECGASWVSGPANKSGITIGTFGEDENLSLTARLNKTGAVDFKPSFTESPRIFLALDMLNIDRGGNTCVRISNSHVMGTQMEWRIDTWVSMSLKEAGASFIAIGI
ncbi:uncharacterized protein FPRO_00021 [Fusarium proliferatum ET1]|uniref:H-type lectin domain-containing protein n=1 Tax=Fusarium proliferatum (strain ET1) TaxID=1227346 RepID=A0A1L7V8K1_FUSPR|nr:uncharacterized protein FPRO_00021 [Fusarium proliferatum ET1]CZR35856.1 uncharacterized protein FPRO_00021 [Fusarium proliferatum ET1]